MLMTEYVATETKTEKHAASAFPTPSSLETLTLQREYYEQEGTSYGNVEAKWYHHLQKYHTNALITNVVAHQD